MVQSPLQPAAEMKPFIVRDHGNDARITRIFSDHTGMSRLFEIGGVVWAYSASGTLIDAFRYSWPRTCFDMLHRKEIGHGARGLKPVALDYHPAPASVFYELARNGEGKHYDYCEAKTQTCYCVFAGEELVGMVAKVHFSDDEAFDRPRTQWFALYPDGHIWSSYGTSREEAGRHLLAVHIDTRIKLAMAA